MQGENKTTDRCFMLGYATIHQLKEWSAWQSEDKQIWYWRDKNGDIMSIYDRFVIYDKPQNDQTAKTDAGKPRLSLVPTEIINCIARVREYGVTKYTDPDNWRRVSVERYHDALFRHVIAYINDPDGVDDESGLPHLWHIATNCAFLCELEKK